MSLSYYTILTEMCYNMVRMKGLEPPRPKALEPKSSAATNYATSAIFLRLPPLWFNAIFLLCSSLLGLPLLAEP